MGVPDLLKFVAKCTSGAIGAIPHGNQPAVAFDYILVDGTNASQTIGLEKLKNQVLTNSHVVCRKSIILIADGQRTRQGTNRANRAVNVNQQSDVELMKLSTEVQTYYRQKAEEEQQKSKRNKNGGGATSQEGEKFLAPAVVVCPRTAEGEGDFKLLNIHRSIVTRHLQEQQEEEKKNANNKAASKPYYPPTFLFVSEDSDVLCGALCGPQSSNIIIGTTLRDTLFDIGLLKVNEVLCYIGLNADVLLFTLQQEREERKQRKLEQEEEERLAARAVRLAEEKKNGGGGGGGGSSGAAVDDDYDPLADDDTEVVKSSANNTEAVVAANEEGDNDDAEEPGRRKKVDGPMKSEGVKMKFDDSSDDDEEEKQEVTAPAKKATAKTNLGSGEEGSINKSVAAAALSHHHEEGEKEGERKKSGSSSYKVSVYDYTAAKYLLESCIDFVFLFSLVKGNGILPGLTKGATKVDLHSLWKSYCALKYKDTDENGKVLGDMPNGEARSFLTITNTNHLSPAVLNSTHFRIESESSDSGPSAAGQSAGQQQVIVLNTKFLRDVLQSVHYSDTHTVVEERSTARQYLKAMLYNVYRYTTGNLCDPRDEQGLFPTAPSLASLVHILQAKDERYYSFSLFEPPVFMMQEYQMKQLDQLGSGAAALDTIKTSVLKQRANVVAAAVAASSGASASTTAGRPLLPSNTTAAAAAGRDSLGGRLSASSATGGSTPQAAAASMKLPKGVSKLAGGRGLAGALGGARVLPETSGSPAGKAAAPPTASAAGAQQLFVSPVPSVLPVGQDYAEELQTIRALCFAQLKESNSTKTGGASSSALQLQIITPSSVCSPKLRGFTDLFELWFWSSAKDIKPLQKSALYISRSMKKSSVAANSFHVFRNRRDVFGYDDQAPQEGNTGGGGGESGATIALPPGGRGAEVYEDQGKEDEASKLYQVKGGHFSFELRRVVPVASAAAGGASSADFSSSIFGEHREQLDPRAATGGLDTEAADAFLDDDELFMEAGADGNAGGGGNKKRKRGAMEGKKNNTVFAKTGVDEEQLAKLRSTPAHAGKMHLSYNYYTPSQAAVVGPLPKRKRKELERQKRKTLKEAEEREAGDKKKKHKRLGKKERQKLAAAKEKGDADDSAGTSKAEGSAKKPEKKKDKKKEKKNGGSKKEEEASIEVE